MSNPQVELHIAKLGVITVELDLEKAPKSTANFLSYVESGPYDNLSQVTELIRAQDNL